MAVSPFYQKIVRWCGMFLVFIFLASLEKAAAPSLGALTPGGSEVKQATSCRSPSSGI
jgi:hypothetical protein